jgi:hypothetical protein
MPSGVILTALEIVALAVALVCVVTAAKAWRELRKHPVSQQELEAMPPRKHARRAVRRAS